MAKHSLPSIGEEAIESPGAKRSVIRSCRLRICSTGQSRSPGRLPLSPNPVLSVARESNSLKKIASAPVGEHQKLLLINCVETYLTLKGPDAEEYASLADAQDSPEIRAMQLTWADKIEAKGIVKGRKEGRAEAREEAADILRRTLVRLTGQRFGTVPLPVRQRLAAIRSVDRLGAIADRILEVQSIEELELGR